MRPGLFQGAIHERFRKLYEIRDFRPYQRGTHRPIGVKLPEQGSIQGELAYISRRHIFDSARRFAVGLEITNQYGRLRDRKAVDLTGDRHSLSPTEKRPYNGNFGAATRHKKFTEAGVIDHAHDLFCQATAVRALQFVSRPRKVVVSHLAAPVDGDIRQRLQETVNQ